MSYLVGDRLGAAECLLHLGDSLRRSGDLPGAHRSYTRRAGTLRR